MKIINSTLLALSLLCLAHTSPTMNSSAINRLDQITGHLQSSNAPTPDVTDKDIDALLDKLTKLSWLQLYYNKNYTELKKEIEKSTDIITYINSPEGQQLLNMITIGKDIPMISFLLQQNIPLNIRQLYNIHTIANLPAEIKNKIDIVSAIKSQKPETLTAYLKTYSGIMFIDAVIKNKDIPIISLLLDKKVDLDLPLFDLYAFDKSLFIRALQQMSPTSLQQYMRLNGGKDLLGRILQDKNKEVLSLLIDKKVDLDLPLYRLYIYWPGICMYILKEMSSVAAQKRINSPSGRDFLNAALSSKDTAIISLLLDKKIELPLYDLYVFDKSLLIRALQHMSPTRVDDYVTTPKGKLFLDRVIRNKDTASISLLIDKKVTFPLYNLFSSTNKEVILRALHVRFVNPAYGFIKKIRAFFFGK